MIRLARKDEGLQAILETIQFSIPSLGNVFLLLLIVYFMFSILGCSFFHDITQGEVIDDLKNFSNFGNSFLLLFAISTGEDWNKIMFDCSRTAEDGCIQGENCGPAPYSYWYFYIMVLTCSHVMLNLFILVIIQQFEKYYLPKESMITMFKDDQKAFMRVWKKFTMDKYRCFKIKESQLHSFFRELGHYGDKNSSLGFSADFFDDGDVQKELLKMGIKSENGFVFFNELLYRCMRRKYGNMKINRKMQVFELKTQYSIYQLTRLAQSRSTKVTNEEVLYELIKKEHGLNPFLSIMNFKISFKVWLKAARKLVVL